MGQAGIGPVSSTTVILRHKRIYYLEFISSTACQSSVKIDYSLCAIYMKLTLVDKTIDLCENITGPNIV